MVIRALCYAISKVEIHPVLIIIIIIRTMRTNDTYRQTRDKVAGEDGVEPVNQAGACSREPAARGASKES